jgi:signal transduction histidine kinase
MLMSASSDFLALCREQITLLAQGMGASLSVVYLTQELVETPTKEALLVPVVIYPETGRLISGRELGEATLNQPIPVASVLALPDDVGKFSSSSLASSQSSRESENTEAGQPNLQQEYLLNGFQVVLPLIYEGVMMGLLVTRRDDRPWNEREQNEIQRIVKTLAIACILDQRRAWLQHQLEQQQILQEEQRDLLDNLLHQFRNPLTALRTFGKLLMKRLRPTDANRDVATSIVRESDRLQELLQQFDRVIDLTTADLAPVSLPKSEVVVEATIQKETKPALLLPGSGEQAINCCITDLLTPLLTSAQAIAQERNLQLLVDIPPQLPLVKVNIKALREVLSNILDNALKYTPSGGKILVQVGQEKGNFQGIAINDTGPGIPPEDLQHLGERYYRGVQAQTEIPGTGLGISIAKQLIEQMQGQIEVLSPAIHSVITTSKSPGTTFMIWLPKAEAGDR